MRKSNKRKRKEMRQQREIEMKVQMPPMPKRGITVWIYQDFHVDALPKVYAST
jgi:hypothetical protein